MKIPENLKLRSELMMRIEELYRKSGMTQAEAAKALGLTQPRRADDQGGSPERVCRRRRRH